MPLGLPAGTPRDFADALKALLPPGAAWEWPVGGMGDGLLLAVSQELARVCAGVPGVLDTAVELHRPGTPSWTIGQYRAVAQAVVSGIVEPPRRPFVVGAHVGDRLWGHGALSTTFVVPLVQLDHLVTPPFRVGRRVGDRLWSGGARSILRVRYYRSVVDPRTLRSALAAFKQAHVALWFEDITGVGGYLTEIDDGSN